MVTSQFSSALAERIESLQAQLQAALSEDDAGEVARVQCALQDLERIRDEHRTQVPRQR